MDKELKKELDKALKNGRIRNASDRVSEVKEIVKEVFVRQLNMKDLDDAEYINNYTRRLQKEAFAYLGLKIIDTGIHTAEDNIPMGIR